MQRITLTETERSHISTALQTMATEAENHAKLRSGGPEVNFMAEALTEAAKTFNSLADRIDNATNVVLEVE